MKSTTGLSDAHPDWFTISCRRSFSSGDSIRVPAVQAGGVSTKFAAVRERSEMLFSDVLNVVGVSDFSPSYVHCTLLLHVDRHTNVSFALMICLPAGRPAATNRYPASRSVDPSTVSVSVVVIEPIDAWEASSVPTVRV